MAVLAFGACERGPELRYVFSPSGLSLRQTPALEGGVIDVLPYGAPVTLITAADSAVDVVVDSISGKWLRIRSGLLEGYAFSGYLTRFPPPAEPDVFPDTGLVRRRFVYGANVLSIRDRPDAVSGPLAFVQYRDSLDLLLGGWRERPDELEGIEGGWVRVRWRSVEGYVFDGYLSEFRPLEERISTAGRQFTLKHVHGIDTLTLHSAPDADATETGTLAYGDSLRVIPAANPITTELDGLSGTWVYGRSPVMEGFVFDGFLSEARPPPRDSLPAGEPPPRPQRRYVLARPGARVWSQSEKRVFTKGFVHYADSVLLLFGGGTRSPALQGNGAGETLVQVRGRDLEGLVAASALSPLPVPPVDADLSTYLAQTIGQTGGADTVPGYDAQADTGTVITRYEWGVSRTHRVLGPGSAETAYRFPDLTLAQAHRILRFTRFNEYFETAEFPTGAATVGAYEVTVRLAPGGDVIGTYAVDTRDGSVTAIESDSAGVVVTFRTTADTVDADSTGVSPADPDSAGVGAMDPGTSDPAPGAGLGMADISEATSAWDLSTGLTTPPPPKLDTDE
jgi:hypothetical protein